MNYAIASDKDSKPRVHTVLVLKFLGHCQVIWSSPFVHPVSLLCFSFILKFPSISSFFLKDVFVGKATLQREETQKNLPSSGSLSNGCNGWIQAHPKPGSHGLGPSSDAFLDHRQRAGLGVEQLRPELAPV